VTDLPLAAASKRLRRPPGRPRTVRVPAGSRGQGSAARPALDAGLDGHRAPIVPVRALGVREAATYLGVSRSQLYDLIARDVLAVVRYPGCRRVVVDVRDLDALIEAGKAPAP
jgi:excisionase family DNA binding protein